MHHALAGEREIQVLAAGHFAYRGMTAEAEELDANRTRFFGERIRARGTGPPPGPASPTVMPCTPRGVPAPWAGAYWTR